MIKCDCKSVVEIFNQIIQGILTEDDINNLSDGDLWSAIFVLTRNVPDNFYKCDWIPSLCNDEGNEDRRREMIEAGIITERQILGNDAADELAKQGGQLHAFSENIIIAQNFRREITMLYQNMMVA